MITRRDFLNGVALTIGATLIPQESLFALAENGYYPPAKTGLRGSHDGSWEIAHALRDGKLSQLNLAPVDTGETYDLVIFRREFSGTAVALRSRRSTARTILVGTGGKRRKDWSHSESNC